MRIEAKRIIAAGTFGSALLLATCTDSGPKQNLAAHPQSFDAQTPTPPPPVRIVTPTPHEARVPRTGTGLPTEQLPVIGEIFLAAGVLGTVGLATLKKSS